MLLWGVLLALLEPAVAKAAATRVAILPLVVHSLDEADYLREGLADMLAARLGRDASIAVVRVGDPELATTDREQARAAGRAAGADFVLFGSFTRFGEGASLDVECARVADDASDPRSIFVQSGTLGELIPQLDGLAARVVAFVRDGPEPPPTLAPAAGSNGAGGISAAELDELRARLDRLENAVYGKPVAELPEAARPEAGFGSASPGDAESEARLR